MSILVTGGAGFIGSHTCVELIESGYDVIVADNLYNSKALVIDRIEKIAGKRPKFYEIDVCDSTGVVYQTSLINNKEDANTLKSYQSQFANKLSTLFGTALTDKSSGNVTSQIHTLDSGLCLESGCMIEDSKNLFWVSFYNESLLS